MGYLPSKNFIAPVFAILVTFFTGWFIYTFFYANIADKMQTAADKKITALSAEDTQARSLPPDSDEDGLFDEEEKIWKTDPKNPDSDGDGVFDGSEVKLGRDPSIKRVVDASGKASDELESPQKSASGENSTMTAGVIKDFMQKYLGLKTALKGGDLPETIKEEIASSVTASIQKGVAAYTDLYAQKDIKISKSADSKKYLNNLATALENNFSGISKTELAVMDSYAESRDTAELESLNKYIAAYKSTLDFLKNEPVPPTYTALHLTLLNSIQNTLTAVQGMQMMPIDPIRSLTGLSLYYEEAARAREFIIGLKAQTEKDKIVFADTEPGSFFKQYFEKI